MRRFELRRDVRAERKLQSSSELTAERPRTRGDCKDGPRPCPWVGCRHHLYIEVNPETGSLKLNFPDLEVDELEHSCALDEADRGPETLEIVGRLMNVTRERMRQLEVDAIAEYKAKGGELND